MSISTIVNEPFRAPVSGALSGARPASLVAAIGVLGVSLYLSHKGLLRVLPDAGELVIALTLLLACLSLLQWTSMGRARACRAAGDRSRAGMVVAQAGLLGLIETALVWNGIVQLAAQAGADWSQGIALVLVAMFALGGAWLNLSVKFVSCEPLADKRAMRTAADHEPPPAARAPAAVGWQESNVLPWTRNRPAQTAELDAGALMQIYRDEVEAPRQAEAEALAARKDAKGRWKKRAA